MSFHHLNRFKAHSNAELTPIERLLAWHFCYETRARTGIYSQSLRRLQEELDLDKRTIQRAMARLVDLGLFERIDRTGIYAPIYRLILACPQSCENLEDHNTKRELEDLKTLLGTNTPPLRDIYTTPYIEKREEEERTLFEQIGSNELGWLIQALEGLPKLTEDQKQLKDLVDQHPRHLAKVAVELTAKMDTAKRKKAYLAKVAIEDPQSLLSKVLDQLAVLEGATRLKNATEEPIPLTEIDIKPEITYKRVMAFAANHYPNWQPSSLVDHYLEGKASSEEGLTEQDLKAVFMFEAVLLEKALPCLRVGLQTPMNAGFYLAWNGLTNTPELRGDLTNALQDDLVYFLYTPEEIPDRTRYITGLEKLKAAWLQETKEEYINPNKFFMDKKVRAWLDLNKDPLTPQEKSRRFIEQFENLFIQLQVKENIEEPSGLSCSAWIEKNFSVIEDFEEFLWNFPERETGSNQKNYKKALPKWLEARKYFWASDLKDKAAAYYDRYGEKPEFIKLPQNWLDDLIKDQQKIEQQVF